MIRKFPECESNCLNQVDEHIFPNKEGEIMEMKKLTLGAATGIGVGVGTALGVAFDNLSLGIALGVAIVIVMKLMSK